MVRVGLFLLLAGCDVVFGLERPVPDAQPPAVGHWLDVTSGSFHGCAIATDRTLWCWGDNVYGEAGLGDGTEFEVLAPAQVGADAWTEVRGGAAHTCGLTTDGALWCWGYNGFGEVGDATRVSRHAPVRIGGDTWIALATGDYFSCAVRADHSLWCWGDNNYGEVGDGTMGQRAEPTLVDATQSWTTVVAGVAHACALTEGGRMWCWGSGPLGGTVPIALRPLEVEPGTRWSAIAAGANATCGVTGGRVECFGGNGLGVLGDGTFASREEAMPISSDRSDWVDVAMRYETACARAAEGTLACWGDNRRGQIGADTAMPVQNTPYVVPQPAAWRAVAPGTYHTCGISDAGELWCTGANGFGQRGDGTGGSVLVPEKLDGDWVTIAAGDNAACGVRAGKLWCWGDNTYGQLGDGTISARQAPVESLLASTNGIHAVGANIACGIDTANQLSCWGTNDEHELIGSTLGFSPFPVVNQNLTSPVHAVTAYAHVCVLSSDNKAYCWGRNSDGQLGRGTVTASESTILPVTDTTTAQPTWRVVTAGVAHTCGIDSNGNVQCWGNNSSGQLGTGSFTSSPRSAATGHAAAALNAGAFHTCAILAANNAAVCWGSNDSGQIGNGTTVNQSSIVVAITGMWTAITAGGAHSCGIRADGTLWCWGNNTRGSLGIGGHASQTLPMQVGAEHWRAVAAGAGYTCGIQVDNSMWCWGQNLLGTVGDNRAWTTRYQQVEGP